jgi:hypothetical protein
MPLIWSSTPTNDDKIQVSRQAQFGRERFLSDQTPERMVCTVIVIVVPGSYFFSIATVQKTLSLRQFSELYQPK